MPINKSSQSFDTEMIRSAFVPKNGGSGGFVKAIVSLVLDAFKLTMKLRADVRCRLILLATKE